MARKYYYLVSGLPELSFDAERKGFDAAALRKEILGELKPADRKYVEMLDTFYDVGNIINALQGKSTFNPLGNLSREEIEEEIKDPERLPVPLARVIEAYRDTSSNEYGIDTSVPIEKTLWEAFYAETARSDNSFIRDWFEFDKTLRNIYTAYTARSNSLPVAKQVVGGGDVAEALSRSQAADFGLRNEVEYMEEVIALLDTKNIIDKETKIDLIKWKKAEELTTFNYFDVNAVLAVLVKADIIQRWAALDPVYGREVFEKLISELVDKEALGRAESEELKKN